METDFILRAMSEILREIEKSQMRDNIPSFSVGDSVKVSLRVSEGEKKRIQIFSGLVISKKGSGANTSFTVRKISENQGVERVLPLHSPQIAKIEVVSEGKVKRSKLYYIRKRSGKRALLVKRKK